MPLPPENVELPRWKAIDTHDAVPALTPTNAATYAPFPNALPQVAL